MFFTTNNNRFEKKKYIEVNVRVWNDVMSNAIESDTFFLFRVYVFIYSSEVIMSIPWKLLRKNQYLRPSLPLLDKRHLKCLLWKYFERVSASFVFGYT